MIMLMAEADILLLSLSLFLFFSLFLFRSPSPPPSHSAQSRSAIYSFLTLQFFFHAVNYSFVSLPSLDLSRSPSYSSVLPILFPNAFFNSPSFNNLVPLPFPAAIGLIMCNSKIITRRGNIIIIACERFLKMRLMNVSIRHYDCIRGRIFM